MRQKQLYLRNRIFKFLYLIFQSYASTLDINMAENIVDSFICTTDRAIQKLDPSQNFNSKSLGYYGLDNDMSNFNIIGIKIAPPN